MIYSYRLGGYECEGEKKLVPSSGTYLCSMEGHMCRIVTLGGKSSLGKNRESSCKGYTKWLCVARHETSLGYMADTQSQGSQHKAQMRQAKLMIMQLQLDIRESRGNRPAKDQEEYEALVKSHGNTIQWTLTP